MEPSEDTRSTDYAVRLKRKELAPWKKWLNVQAPYRWNLARQELGRTLEVGCGIGRNLLALPPGSVGVDHNVASVEFARQRGLEAYTTDEWPAALERKVGEGFDSILLAHVVEHLVPSAARGLLTAYLPLLRTEGKVFLICPQERGYSSDPTHVYFATDEDLRALAVDVGLEPLKSFSFPLPRFMGRLFTYNEFCVLATKPSR